MFKVGERVFDISKGWGRVARIDTVKDIYPLVVDYGNKEERYTIDGREYDYELRTLYHHDYTPNLGVIESVNAGKSENDLLLQKFAGMAMQGILAGDIQDHLGECRSSDRIASFSIECAYAMIKALETKNNA